MVEDREKIKKYSMKRLW